MPKNNLSEVVGLICEQDARYAPDAYHFVDDGLKHTLKILKRGGQSAHRHVSVHELLQGLREFALKEYGPMSKAVLNEWGLKTTEDFGNVVFNLVKANVLGKNESDCPTDFCNVFSFDDAFVKPFVPARARQSDPSLTKPAKRSKSSKKNAAGSV